MMDSSDGLVFTIYEIMRNSKLGSDIFYDKIPLSKKLIKLKGRQNAMKYALYGGEDYELVFTTPAKKINALLKLFPNVVVIGKVAKHKNIRFINNKGQQVKVIKKGYEALKVVS